MDTDGIMSRHDRQSHRTLVEEEATRKGGRNPTPPDVCVFSAIAKSSLHFKLRPKRAALGGTLRAISIEL